MGNLYYFIDQKMTEADLKMFRLFQYIIKI